LRVDQFEWQGVMERGFVAFRLKTKPFSVDFDQENGLET
jgi:hypothetical protein